MKALTFFFLISIPFLSLAQTGNDYIRRIQQINHFHEQIQAGTSWDELLEMVQGDSVLEALTIIPDLEQSIAFTQNKPQQISLIDSLFITACARVHTEYPFRQSGNLDYLLTIRNAHHSWERNMQKAVRDSILTVVEPSPTTTVVSIHCFLRLWS